MGQANIACPEFFRGTEYEMALYTNKFPEEFSKLLEKTNITPYKISAYTGLTESYLSRLKSGEKQNPSPEAIVKISLAIVYYSDKATLYDIQKLFKSRGLSID
jgi:transcriptional regulator with XRE-family HTH domain